MKPVSFCPAKTSLIIVVIVFTFAPRPIGSEVLGVADNSYTERITALRTVGDYAVALSLAEEARSQAQTRGQGRTVELADLERLVATLKHLVALPETSRVAMARADSLLAAFEALRLDARYGEVQSSTQEAIEIQTAYLGKEHYEVGLSISRLAFAKQNLGDLAGAEPIYTQALCVLRSNLGESHPEIAEVLDWMGVLYLMQSKYEKSDSVLVEALEMYKHFTDSSRGIAITLNDLAHLMFLRGDHAGSEQVHQEAIDMWRKIGDKDTPGCATTLDNFGVLYAMQGRYLDAEPLYREALSIRRKLLRSDHPDVAVSLNNLAGLNFVQGNYTEAAPLYHEALAIKRKTLPAGHQSLALGLTNLGSVVYKQGDVEEAIVLLEEALQIFRNNLPPGHNYIALASNNLATVMSVKGDYARAESLYVAALSIYRVNLGEKHESVATLISNIAKVKISQNQFTGAETRFRDALEIYEYQFGPVHPSVANCLGNMSAMLIRQERYAEAEVELRRALSIYDALLMSTSPNAVAAMSLLGSVQIQIVDLDEAVVILESACDAFEIARRRVNLGGLKRTAYTASESPYPLLADAYLRRGEYASAWKSVEKDNGRGLLEMLEIRSARPLTDDEIADEQRLDQELGRLENTFVALANDTVVSRTAKIDSIRTQLLEAQAHWSRYQKQLSQKYPIAEGGLYSLERIQSILGEGCAIVGWLDREDSHYAYMIPRKGPVIWEKLPTVQIDSLAHAYMDAVVAGPADTDVHTYIGRSIYAARIKPLAKHLVNVNRIFVIPSGPTLGIPMEALPTDDGQYMIDKWEISYTPSATVLAWLRQKPKREGDPSLFVIGDPPFDDQQASAMAANAGASDETTDRTHSERSGSLDNGHVIQDLKRLGGSRKEATDIAAMFETSEVLLGEDASEAVLVAKATDDEFASFRYLHFATHALIDDKKVARSCLVLSQVDLPDPLETVISGGRIIDGRLTVDEVMREWRLDADLVTLSACETALGRKVRGEGYIGFAHAFFHAGTRSVVVSLWQVDDRATRRLMVRFYENMLERNMTRSAALREAKRWLRDLKGRGDISPFAHPAYWSGFILIGDPD
jgi:CHAT domain-containing protein/Tfp pilus assembly protein PilF